MKIAILGAGALGCYYGARLQESGQDVSFIVRSEYDYLKEHGLEVKSLHGNISLPRIKYTGKRRKSVRWISSSSPGKARPMRDLPRPSLP